MRNGSSALLVDTNVLVSAYDPTEGAKRERAITVLECLGARQMGAVSAQILGEFFVTVTRKIPSPLTEAEAERSVTHDVRSWGVSDLTEQVVLEAVRGLHWYGAVPSTPGKYLIRYEILRRLKAKPGDHCPWLCYPAHCRDVAIPVWDQGMV